MYTNPDSHIFNLLDPYSLDKGILGYLQLIPLGV